MQKNNFDVKHQAKFYFHLSSDVLTQLKDFDFKSNLYTSFGFDLLALTQLDLTSISSSLIAFIFKSDDRVFICTNSARTLEEQLYGVLYMLCVYVHVGRSTLNGVYSEMCFSTNIILEECNNELHAVYEEYIRLAQDMVSKTNLILHVNKELITSKDVLKIQKSLEVNIQCISDSNENDFESCRLDWVKPACTEVKEVKYPTLLTLACLKQTNLLAEIDALRAEICDRCDTLIDKEFSTLSGLSNDSYKWFYARYMISQLKTKIDKSESLQDLEENILTQIYTVLKVCDIIKE